MSSSKNYKLFIHIVLFPAFVLPFVLSIPIPNSPYDKFISFATENKCTTPKDLKLPFPESSDPSSFNYLFTPLIECRTSDDTDKYNEVNMLCTEIFDVLKDITCVKYNLSFSAIESDHFSEDVCHDFENLKGILPQKDNYLSGRLSDNLLCKVFCSEGKYELCKTLLWSYDTLMKIKYALHDENQIQKTGNESIDDKVSPDKVISPAQPDVVGVKSETVSQNTKEPDKTKVAGSGNPDEGNLPEFNLNQTDQESHNPKVPSDLGETVVSQDISSKKELPDTQVQIEAIDKTTSIAKNVTTTVQQNKSETENEKLSPEISENSVNLVESKTLSSVKLQTENIDNENKIDVSVPKKGITVSEAKINKNSLTSNENEIKDKQNLKNVTVYNLQNNGDYNVGSKEIKGDSNVGSKEVKGDSNVGSKEVKGDSNVGSKEVKGDSNVASKTSEKSAEPVSPATLNDNELKSSNFPEEEGKPKQTDLESQKGKEIEKPKQTDFESPNEVLPDTDSKLPEPSTPSALPDEDIEHQEDKDQEQYNDIENDADYAKPEYDNSFNLPSKNKESVVQIPIPAGSNQMTNNYGSNISPKDNINRISEEIAMIAPFPEQEDGHFFFYFLSIVLIIMAGYLIFHNKQKIIALIVEGRHERRRRSHGAGYKKLETK